MRDPNKREFIYRPKLSTLERGSPSLVGRGIANPMSARTRGFKSHPPRLFVGIIVGLSDFALLSSETMIAVE